MDVFVSCTTVCSFFLDRALFRHHSLLPNIENKDNKLLGGRVPEYICLNEHVPKIVAYFFEENKPVGAIYHATLVLTFIGLTIWQRGIV